MLTRSRVRNDGEPPLDRADDERKETEESSAEPTENNDGPQRFHDASNAEDHDDSSEMDSSHAPRSGTSTLTSSTGEREETKDEVPSEEKRDDKSEDAPPPARPASEEDVAWLHHEIEALKKQLMEQRGHQVVAARQSQEEIAHSRSKFERSHNEGGRDQRDDLKSRPYSPSAQRIIKSKRHPMSIGNMNWGDIPSEGESDEDLRSWDDPPQQQTPPRGTGRDAEETYWKETRAPQIPAPHVGAGPPDPPRLYAPDQDTWESWQQGPPRRRPTQDVAESRQPPAQRGSPYGRSDGSWQEQPRRTQDVAESKQPPAQCSSPYGRGNGSWQEQPHRPPPPDMGSKGGKGHDTNPRQRQPPLERGSGGGLPTGTRPPPDGSHGGGTQTGGVRQGKCTVGVKNQTKSREEASQFNKLNEAVMSQKNREAGIKVVLTLIKALQEQHPKDTESCLNRLVEICAEGLSVNSIMPLLKLSTVTVFDIVRQAEADEPGNVWQRVQARQDFVVLSSGTAADDDQSDDASSVTGSTTPGSGSGRYRIFNGMRTLLSAKEAKKAREIGLEHIAEALDLHGGQTLFLRTPLESNPQSNVVEIIMSGHMQNIFAARLVVQKRVSSLIIAALEMIETGKGINGLHESTVTTLNELLRRKTRSNEQHETGHHPEMELRPTADEAEKLYNPSSQKDRTIAAVAHALHSSSCLPGLSSANVLIAEVFIATQNVSHGTFFGVAAKLFSALDRGLEPGEDFSVFHQRIRDTATELESAQLQFGVQASDLGINLDLLGNDDILARSIVLILESQLGMTYKYTQLRGNLWDLKNRAMGSSEAQLKQIKMSDILTLIDRRNEAATDAGSTFIGLPSARKKREKKSGGGDKRDDAAAFNAVDGGGGGRGPRGRSKDRKGKDRKTFRTRSESTASTRQFAKDFCVASRRIGEAAQNSGGDQIRKVDAAVRNILQEGYDMLDEDAKKCFAIKDMGTCGKHKAYLTQRGVGYMDEKIRASPGCGYIRAVFDISNVENERYRDRLSRLVKKVDKSQDGPTGDVYNFTTLLKRWRKDSDLARWLIAQKRYSDKSPRGHNPKEAYGATADAAPADDGDGDDADGGDGN